MCTEPVLEDLFAAFLSYKRSNGYTYIGAEYHLSNYVKFENANYPGAIMSKDSVESYITSISDSVAYLKNSISYLREFARFLQGLGYKAYLCANVRVTGKYQPYLFSEEEIREFFNAVDLLKCRARKGRYIYITLPAVFRVLYCCGLRCCEIRRLKRAEVSLEAGTIDILNSKGPKDRRIFMSDELCEYLKTYDKEISAFFIDRIYFFPGRKACSPLNVGTIPVQFNKIWNLAFPDNPRNKMHGSKPRAYDFRHNFACYNINRWAKEKKDVNSLLPYLARHMGHSTINETLYYFHLTPHFFNDLNELSFDTQKLIPVLGDG